MENTAILQYGPVDYFSIDVQVPEPPVVLIESFFLSIITVEFEFLDLSCSLLTSAGLPSTMFKMMEMMIDVMVFGVNRFEVEQRLEEI
jgi:hypothetical protein